ncbi:MAG: hypothetical protein KIT85_14465 [Pseudolabrys sp.]|nr:hypothetical protein [Pseudolabrys sp.]
MMKKIRGALSLPDRCTHPFDRSPDCRRPRDDHHARAAISLRCCHHPIRRIANSIRLSFAVIAFFNATINGIAQSGEMQRSASRQANFAYSTKVESSGVKRLRKGWCVSQRSTCSGAAIVSADTLFIA